MCETEHYSTTLTHSYLYLPKKSYCILQLSFSVLLILRVYKVSHQQGFAGTGGDFVTLNCNICQVIRGKIGESGAPKLMSMGIRVKEKALRVVIYLLISN